VSQDWVEQTFGPCPHDLITPYCPQCVGDELEAKWEKKCRENDGKPTPHLFSAL
jgi:hypothetical protein